MTTYVYRGDRLTDDRWRGAVCEAVRRPDGKCIRGRNGSMLVRFACGTLVVVLGRQLRKVRDDRAAPEANVAKLTERHG